jgi:hypothetical protein
MRQMETILYARSYALCASVGTTDGHGSVWQSGGRLADSWGTACLDQVGS